MFKYLEEKKNEQVLVEDSFVLINEVEPEMVESGSKITVFGSNLCNLFERSACVFKRNQKEYFSNNLNCIEGKQMNCKVPLLEDGYYDFQVQFQNKFSAIYSKKMVKGILPFIVEATESKFDQKFLKITGHNFKSREKMTCRFKKSSQIFETGGISANNELMYCLIPVLPDYLNVLLSVSNDNLLFSADFSFSLDYETIESTMIEYDEISPKKGYPGTLVSLKRFTS